MDRIQYEHTHRNKRRYDARPLLGGAEVDKSLRSARRSTQARQRAHEAWDQVIPHALRDEAVVERFENGCLEISACDTTALHELRQRSTELTRSLSGLLPGLRRLRFIIRNTPEQAESDRSYENRELYD